MKTILVEKKDHVALVTLNRPKELNVLNRVFLTEIDSELKKIAGDKSIRCVVLTGAGKAFAAGADIEQMSTMTAEEALDFAQTGQKLFTFIERMPQPVIACINGFALGGGCELACACDLRSASKKCKIGEPEAHLGIIPGFGGSVRLPRLIGMSRAKQLILTGEAIDGTHAEEIGLVNWVFNEEELLPKTMNLAKRIAAKPLSALSAIKKVMHQTLDLPAEDAHALEAKTFSECFLTEDPKEGMRAFLEKRSPKFNS